ncbi:MAG: hypothetical protein ACFFDF_08060 [Candidatus Odinarchaeota archaeon]
MIYFKISFHSGDEDLGTENLPIMKLDILLENIRAYLVDMNLNELDIKIKKVSIPLDKSDVKIPEIEMMTEGV